MPGKWTAERRARYQATLQAKREQKQSPPIRKDNVPVIYYYRTAMCVLLKPSWLPGHALQVIPNDEFNQIHSILIERLPDVFRESFPFPDDTA